MIESQKYSLESDFVQSYINKFLIQKLFFTNRLILNDASVFSSCVNMNQLSLNLANCTSRRERVENFIQENEEKFKPYKDSIEKCTPQLHFAYSLQRNFDTNKSLSHTEKNFLTSQLKKAEKQLEECLDNNLN